MKKVRRNKMERNRLYFTSGLKQGYHPKTDEEIKEACQQTHPGFEIKCLGCGSTNVCIDSDVGYSETSGAWGGVQLICFDCKQETEIWSA
jgi:hypothetical protein